MNTADKFRFVDLFAGIGGFHQAMTLLGGECVLACEINKDCQQVYRNNFPDTPVHGDICELNPEDIPEFDVLCAGFPCQPFSKAGYQKGFSDEKRGTLFHRVIDILEKHKEVKFIILENVRNLADNKDNWAVIQKRLTGSGFYVTKEPIILSPSDFGIPQIRERVFILGIRQDIIDRRKSQKDYIDISDLSLDEYYKPCTLGSAWNILEQDVSDDYIIPEEIELMISAWNELRLATKTNRIGCPFWISCFGVGFDDEEESRKAVGYYDMPEWKKKFYRNNRGYYLKNKEIIDKWLVKYDMRSRIKLHQKFEWNCGDDCPNVHDTIIQVRQSGIRIKRPNFFPSLVAMVNTPIVWDAQKNHYRHITPREAANLQNFDKDYKFNESDNMTYTQLGNSVNVKVLEILGLQLFKLAKPLWRVK